VLVSVTDFHVPRAADLVHVYLQGIRLTRAWPSLSGAVGMWMWTKPLRRRAGSVSVWRDEADLRRFLRSRPHVRVMRDYRDKGEISSTSWLEASFDPRSVWANAAARLARGHLQAEQEGAAA
jgi:heme-degrading monooxygenase HmoA